MLDKKKIKEKLEIERDILLEELRDMGKLNTETGEWEATPGGLDFPESDQNDIADRFDKVKKNGETNYELIKQVQHLLLRLGILSKISKTSKKGYQDVWNVHVQGKTEQIKFLSKVGSVGRKKEEAKKAKAFLNTISENPNNDVVPKKMWNFVKEILKNKNITARDFQQKMNWAYSGTQRYSNGISRARLLKIYRVLKDKMLKTYAESDIYWDEVKSIEYVGVKNVYDATVPKNANFVANDIIVHNSIEQDADVVMFLWREDEEDSENMMLDIAKHRNGPLRSVPLRFRGDRIKFFGRETKHTK